MGALTEYIFSHAVALNQSGRLKNEIFVHNRDVFILNSDNTVLLSFKLPSREPTFKNPIAFSANDYDSENFREENGKIIFTQKNVAAGIVRTKTCSGVNKCFGDVEAIFKKFYRFDSDKMDSIRFVKNVLSSIEENLSHIEFSSENKRWKLIQRDIYTGSVIELRRDAGKTLGMDDRDSIKRDFSPIGIRTNDFVALFQFNEQVVFYFPPGADGYCLVSGDTYDMKGVLGTCVYDEMGTLKIAKTKKGKIANGRQK